jgi:uncharacterized protein with HEPN domain
MESSDVQRIKHIKQYCEDIADSINRFGAKYEIFANDKDYFNSISMSIMQIGELTVGLTDAFKESTKNQMQWGAIRSARNMYAHAYAKMDKISIWETATKDIPGLRQFCDDITKQLEIGNNKKPGILGTNGKLTVATAKSKQQNKEHNGKSKDAQEH